MAAPTNRFTASAAHPASSARRLLMPREHGAWGMLSLPFLAGVLVAGGSAPWRTLAASLAVLSVFLLRTPLLVLWRSRAFAGARRGRVGGAIAQETQRRELEQARFSLLVYGAAAAVSGIYLLRTLPPALLLAMGSGAALLTGANLFFTVRNQQRHPAFQIVGAIGLTASSLVGYLAVRGHLESVAFWIWGLSAAHSIASVLVVHARLESIIAGRKPVPAPSGFTHRRNALLAQLGLWFLLAALALQGTPWLILPFVPPALLHGWELWDLSRRQGQRVSLRRVGWTQLATSVAFSFLLVAILR